MTRDGLDVWSKVQTGLRAFVAKRVADDAAVDDILQQVFLRMHEKIDRVKDPRRIVSWVYQITRHALADYYRAPQRRREVPVGLAGDLEPGLSVSAETPQRAGELRAQLAGCLRPMIERLANEYREAVTLVELEGMTQVAAARRLGLSVSGMKSRVQRGRRRLKRMLHDCCLIELDRRRGIANYTVRDPLSASCAGRALVTPARRHPRD
jgi:RNA polymerase sigma-70 factor (ECF subfamily)